jgi:AraC-like DNA-binding protein
MARKAPLPTSTLAGELAVQREAQSFPAFPAPPPADPLQLANWLEATAVRAVSGVEWFCSERWALGPRVVNDSMWFYIVAGTGWGRVGAEGAAPRFDLGPGDLMLIPQGSEHIVRQDPGMAMHLFAVHFHAQVFEGVKLLELLGFPHHLPKAAGTDLLREVSERVTREFNFRAPGWRASMSAEIQRALFFIVREHGARFTPPGAGRHARELPRLLPAFEWLEQNLEDPGLSVRALAQRVHVSEVQFRKLFKRATGLSPVRFIQRRRVERAGNLLRETELSLEQVAEESGFSDSAFFCRVFKAWTKYTPGSYRKALSV